jgi:hypothetical protein
MQPQLKIALREFASQFAVLVGLLLLLLLISAIVVVVNMSLFYDHAKRDRCQKITGIERFPA